MAIVQTSKNQKFEEKILKEKEEKLQSDAVKKLYKNKKQIDNSKNVKYNDK